MSQKKERLTVTVDRALVEAARGAVVAGRADSLSGRVNLALAERAAKERRLGALSGAIEAYEEEFGEISPAELLGQEREDRREAIAVRDRSRKRRRRKAA